MVQRLFDRPPGVRPREFTIDDVERMLVAGILGEDDPVELLAGELIVVSPQGPEHAGLVGALAERLRDLYGAAHHVREEKPLRCGATSCPEPDLAVVPGRPLDYVGEHPVGSAAILVIEVARTSQALDRLKADVYARGGVPAYWLLDLEARTLEVYEGPSDEGYRRTSRLLEDERAAFPGLSTSTRVGELLPPHA